MHLPSQMEARNPQVRLAVFSKIKRMIESYKGHKVKNIDRRLLRGLFLRNLKEFDEDYKEKQRRKSLLSRLTEVMTI